MLHVGIAALTSTPEIELDSTDANNLAVPLTGIINEAAKKYHIPVPSKEMRLGFMLLVACGVVYRPRWKAINQRHRAEKAQRAGGSSTAAQRPPKQQPQAAPVVVSPLAATGHPPSADPSLPIIASKLQ